MIGKQRITKYEAFPFIFMKEAFPQLSVTIHKSLALQSLVITESEDNDLKRIPEESYNFYLNVMKCKNKNNNQAIKCVGLAIEKSSCKEKYSQMIHCAEYLTNGVPNKDKNLTFCYKEDHNLAFCVEQLTYPIIFSLSKLPRIT